MAERSHAWLGALQWQWALLLYFCYCCGVMLLLIWSGPRADETVAAVVVAAGEGSVAEMRAAWKGRGGPILSKKHGLWRYVISGCSLTAASPGPARTSQHEPGPGPSVCSERMQPAASQSQAAGRWPPRLAGSQAVKLRRGQCFWRTIRAASLGRRCGQMAVRPGG